MNRKSTLKRVFQSLWRILAERPRIPSALQDNTLLQTVLNRRSVRRFKTNEIPEDIFAAILEAGRLAPSTVNLQTWSFITFTQKDWSETFGAPIPFKGQRAVIMVGDTYRARMALDAFPDSPLVEYTIAVINASLAAMNMNIAAEALGVSSVMLSETGRSGLLDAGYLKEKLALPEHTVPLMTIVFGYPASAYPPMPPKLPLEAVCSAGRYPVTERKVMLDWLAQIEDGYKVSYFPSTFEKQLKVYQSKIAKAEADLQKIVFTQK
jgi:FMN reductase (NADPH)